MQDQFVASKRLPNYPAFYPKVTEQSYSRLSHVLTDFYRPHIIKLPVAVVISFDLNE
jgi:hypothetical protein